MPRTAGLHPQFEGTKKVTGADVQHLRAWASGGWRDVTPATSGLPTSGRRQDLKCAVLVVRADWAGVRGGRRKG
jgi:hypothetical protein